MLKTLNCRRLAEICDINGYGPADAARHLGLPNADAPFTLKTILPICERDAEVRTRIRASIQQHPAAWSTNPDELVRASRNDADLRAYINRTGVQPEGAEEPAAGDPAAGADTVKIELRISRTDFRRLFGA